MLLSTISTGHGACALIVGSNMAMTAIAATLVCLIAAIVLAVLAVRQIAAAREAMRAARFVRELLAAGPTRAMLLHADGSLEIDQGLARELAVAPTMPSLSSLGTGDGGLEQDDVEQLFALTESSRLGGEAISTLR